MTHPSETELNDLLDGALPAGRAAAVEAHCAACAPCARELRGLTAIVARAGRLPRELPPLRDLRPARRARRPARAAAWLAAAAIILLLAVAWRADRAAPPAGGALWAQYLESEQGYVQASRALEAALRREAAAGTAVAVPAGEIRAVDRRIESLRGRLERDPEDVELMHELTRTYLHRLDLLHQAMVPASGV